MPSVTMLHVSLDDVVVEGFTRVVLRGVVDPQSLHLLRVDDYQREAQPLKSQASIMEALASGEPLPDIELGMRGDHFDVGDPSVTLHDQVFIIDGLQRVTTALHVLNTKAGLQPHLGATVHLNTTREWEKRRFQKLNSSRLKVAPSILMRNMKDESPAIRLLLAVSSDPEVAFRGRVQWDQRLKKGELMSALTLARVAGLLHAHKAPTRSAMRVELTGGLDKLIGLIGAKNVRENIVTYFNLMDQCWGLRNVHYKEGARHLRTSFMYALAETLSNHTDFWMAKDTKLIIATDLQRKFKSFPVNTDPHIGNLTGSSGKATDILYTLLVDHVNAGKRSRRLTDRTKQRPTPRVINDNTDGEELAKVARSPGPGDC